MDYTRNITDPLLIKTIIDIFDKDFKEENNSVKLAIEAKNKQSTKRIIINILCSVLFIAGVTFGIFYYMTDGLVYGIIAIVFMLIGSIIGIKSDKIK